MQVTIDDQHMQITRKNKKIDDLEFSVRDMKIHVD
jgi:hypothetical protein